MKSKFQITKCLTLLVAIIAFGKISHAQEAFTSKTAHKWVKTGAWKNGLKLNLHPSTNELEFAKQYQANKAVWDKAFTFLREQDLEKLAPGKYPIDGDNAYASITEAPSKEFEQSGWESHKNYIDLQYVIRGEEKIGVTPIENATVTSPYDAAKDGAKYSGDGKYYIATPKEFFLFFPTDVHRPNIKVDGYDVVKKLVIKIRVAN